MAFPTTLTNAVDGTTEIIADHLNNLEAKIGIDSSSVTTSLDYKVKNTLCVNPGHKHDSVYSPDGLTEVVTTDNSGNVGINAVSFGMNAAGVLAIGDGTGADTSPADMVQVWAANRATVAGTTGLYIRPEGGNTHFFGDRVGVQTITPTTALDINSDTIRLRNRRTISSISSTGNAGEICFDASYLYCCIATDSWKRATLATWS